MRTGSREKNDAPGIHKVLGAFFLDVGFLGIVWFAGMILATAIWTLGSHFSSGGLPPNSQPGPLATMLMGLSSFYLSILVLSAVRGRNLATPLNPASESSLATLAILTGLVMCLLTMTITYTLQQAGIALNPGNQMLLEDAGKSMPTVAGILVVLIAPVFEELLFRKQVFARFYVAGYAGIGYFISSLLFALMHEPLPTQGLLEWGLMLVLYGAMGATFAWVYQKTGKLWLAILTHASNNLFAVGAIFLT